MKRHLLTVVIALMALTANAQSNNLNIEAQLLTRGEHNNGALKQRYEGQQSANYISERARLSFDFKRSDLELKASVQHTGLWGQDDIRQTDGKATISEAWAKMTFGRHFFAQIGRQQLAYDDERILGAQDWDMENFRHDALKLGYESWDLHHRVHLIVAMNQEKANRGDYYEGPMPYKNMEGLWYHYGSPMTPLDISLLALNVGYERGDEGHGRTNYMQTFGTDISYSFGRPLSWNIRGSFYYQMGKTSLRQVEAFMASGNISYTFTPQRRFKLSAGYDYMSGNNYDNPKWNAFNALYGSYHRFFGSMDFFGNTLTWGLQDIKGSISSHICKKVRLDLNYHYLMTATQITDLKKELGHEFDVELTAKLKKDVTLSAGYSTILGTETLDRIASGNHEVWQDWAWLQLNICPSALFSSK